MDTNDPNTRQGNRPPPPVSNQQQQENKKCHGNRRYQRFRRRCRASGMNSTRIEKIINKRNQTNNNNDNIRNTTNDPRPTTVSIQRSNLPKHQMTTTTIPTNLNKRKRDISVQELKSISTITKSTNSISIVQQPVPKKIKNKKKTISIPSIKVTQNFIYKNYRRPIYLKRSLSIILQMLTNKLNYKFKKENEQKFIYQRLHLLDQQYCLKVDQQLWQSYLDIGLQQHIWPNQLYKMAKTNKSELCQKYLVNYLEKIKKQLDQCEIELTNQSQSYRMTTLSLNQLDPCLQEYVDCQRKYLFIRNKDQLIKFKDHIHQKDLFKTITTTPITNNQNELIHRLITIRQQQGEIWKELLTLEMRILYKFLPLNFDHLENFLGSIQYSPLNNNQKSIQIKNQRYKIIQEAKRTWLNIHLNAYIIKIQAYDQQYQNEFRQLESQIMNDNNRTTTNDTNSSSLLNKIKDYLTNRTNRLKEEIYNQISSSSYRMKLVQNRQRSSSTKTIIGVSPEPYLDLLCNPLNTCQWAHLLLGPSYIRSNQSATHSRKQQENEIEKLHKEICEKVKCHLVQPPYRIPITNPSLKQYSDHLRNYLNHCYFTPLSYKDQIQAQEQAHTIASIRKLIKTHKLILRQVDKGNTFYIGSASTFEEKIQKYFTETNAFMELSYNPFNETLEKVIAILNRLCLDKLISKAQHKQMMPDRSKVELAHLYFNPKTHKDGIPVRPIENTIRAITKKISDYLHQIIAPIFNEKCHATIIMDSAHLIKELQTYQQKGLLKPTTLFCTFDIHNLYTMLPQDQSIDILGEFLETHGKTEVDKINIKTIKELASIVLKENVFVYNNKFYRQTLGGAMGSSFTLTLANIFMWKWQKEFVRQKEISGEYFGRYIDDVFMTWNRSEQTLRNLLKDANTWHPNIKMDYKIIKSLPFLDVLLTNNNGILSTFVYHKPTADPYVVPFNSDHCRHVFANIIQTSLKRAVRSSSTFEAFQDEQRYIRLMLLYNGYPSSFIDEQFRKFSLEYLSSSSFLPVIDNEKQYFLLHHKIIGQPTARQSQVAISITNATGNIDFDQLNTIEETESIGSNKKSTKKPYGNKILFHYTHEKRFQSFKRDMHKIYEDTFKNTCAMEVRIIVGNRNRRDTKNELIRKRPKRAILQNKPIEKKPKRSKKTSKSTKQTTTTSTK